MVNARVHRVTRRAPNEMLAHEQARLHPVPASAHTVAFGVARTVPPRSPMVSLDGGQYSVPHTLRGQSVWVRVHGAGADEQVIIVHVSASGPVEIARHGRATPGSPRIDDAHFPPAPVGALDRAPKEKNQQEMDFLALGDGARLWLVEAAAAGAGRMRVKMAAAVDLAKLRDPVAVDWALAMPPSTPASARPTSPSILAHHARTNRGTVHQAGEGHSLAQGTKVWSALPGQLGAGKPVAGPELDVAP